VTQALVSGKKKYAVRYVANNHRNRSSVSNIIQRLQWRPLADRRKDARLVMLYKIDRELVAIYLAALLCTASVQVRFTVSILLMVDY
jgi:hypothetical protein